MEYAYQQTTLSKHLSVGVLTGYLLTIFNLFYDFLLRSLTNFTYSEIVNVSSIIFSSMLFMIIASLIYHFLYVNFKMAGAVIYVVGFAILTIVLFITASHIGNHFTIPIYNDAFRMQFMGYAGITGGFATIVIPFISRAFKYIF
ncbi:MAG: hypothetical protein KGK14_03620 [Bacteroidota bacterium]|jgi:hypothetical protein|nr:hypothetical protein [Bacteroidota bacterium]